MADYYELIGAEVERRKYDPKVSPIVIADSCMQLLDPGHISVPEVYIGCHLYLRQIARGALARSYDPADKKKRERDAKAVGDLFKLQARYPEAHTADLDDAVYVRRDLMTAEDVDYNEKRLRAEGAAKIAHADALRAWWDSRPSSPPPTPAPGSPAFAGIGDLFEDDPE